MKRVVVAFFVACMTLGLTACSFRAHFILVNKSGKEVRVKYKLHEAHNFIAFPMLGITTIEQLQEHNNYDPLPPNRYTVDTDNLIYNVKLNDREILFLTMVDIRDIDEEPVFKSGLSELSIENESGSVTYVGDMIFPQFVPSGGGIWPGAPLRYTITYK